jgi:hypothetical protein
MPNPRLRASLLHALAFLAAAPLAGCATSTTGDVLAAPVPAIGFLAVDPGGIFFVEGNMWEGPTPPVRLPLSGGAPAALGPSSPISALVLDHDSVFCGTESFELPGPPVWSFTIDRVPQVGGATQTLVSGDGFLNGMAVAGGSLVYVTQYGDPLRPFDAPEAGSGAVFVQPVAPPGQPPATPVQIAQDLPQPCAFAADSAHAYWLDCTKQELLSLPLSSPLGTAPTVLASGLKADPDSGPLGPQLIVAAGQLYWFEGVAVRTVPASGGAPITVASKSGWTPAQLMADEKALYWMTAMNDDAPSDDTSDDSQPGLWTADAAGGSLRRVLGPDVSPVAVAMDADFVYWLDSADGSVRRLSR